MLGAAFLSRLAEVVGAGQLLRAPDELARYDIDGRQGGGAACAVVRPGSRDEVAAVMRLAAEEGVTLVPQGGRTGLMAAGLAAEDGEQIVVSLERLSRPPRIDPVNRSAQVDAGVLLSAINAAAADHGLFFPIDLGADPSIGGMIATNTGGARLLRYGDVRRNVLAAEIVLADGRGTVVQLGRGLWKDNSGLDLKQLWIGGAGSLGIVTSATIALQPKPVAAVTAMLALEDPDAAMNLLLALEREFGTLLTAFEGISRPALAAALDHVPGLRNPFAAGLPSFAVLVEVAAGRAIGEEGLEDALAAALAPFMDGDHAAVLDVAIDRRDGLWAIRHALPEGLRAKGKVIGCDVSVKRGDIIRFREDAKARLAVLAPALEVHDFGHIGDGGLHYNLVWPASAGPFDPRLGEQARDLIFRTTVETYGGSFSAEHGIGPVNAAYYAQLVSPAERELAGAVQQLLAPQSLGRVNFGSGVLQ